MIKIPLDEETSVVTERRIPKKGPHVRSRTDVRTRAVIDKALELQNIVGTGVAAGLLANKNVPFDVAQRVLSNPRRRRKG